MSHPGTGPVVSFENVSKHYGSLKAVDGLSLDLRTGETVALLGPNGAGKSTSLDMLLALRKPTSGKIEMFGSDPYHAVKSGKVGAMLQSGGLMPEVTVRELVTLVTGLHPRPVPVDTTLRRAGIATIADQRVDRLSGGQTQRVRFALAIVGDVRPDRAGRADDGDGRGDQAAVLVQHERGGRGGQDAAVRDPLPGGGRPGRGPDPGDQQGPAARGRHAGRDQGAGRGEAAVVPAGDGWTSRSCWACPGW